MASLFFTKAQKRIVTIVIVIVVMIIVGFMLIQSEEKKEVVVRVGIVNALTGTAADLGLPVLHGALIAKEEINTSGGVNGARLEFIIEDGKCTPKEAATAAKKLIERERVAIPLSGCSSETLAISPLAEQKKIILIGMVSTSPRVSNVGDFVFRTSPSDLLGLQKFAETTYRELKYRKVAILSEQRDYPKV